MIHSDVIMSHFIFEFFYIAAYLRVPMPVDDDKSDIVNSDFYPLSLPSCCEDKEKQGKVSVYLSQL